MPRAGVIHPAPCGRMSRFVLERLEITGGGADILWIL